MARPPKSPSASPSRTRRLAGQSSTSGARTNAPSGAGHRTFTASTPASTRGLTDAKPRRRRDAAAARAAILDAGERHLVFSGPSGIRLQEVAADAGVSHPTVLHHFGTREGLVKAVITRSLAALDARVAEAISRSSGDTAQVAAMQQPNADFADGSRDS